MVEHLHNMQKTQNCILNTTKKKRKVKKGWGEKRRREQKRGEKEIEREVDKVVERGYGGTVN